MKTAQAGDFAVILNENARKVTRRVVRSAREIVPRFSLYSSRTQEEGRQILRDLLDRGVRRIIAGGGDGTLVHLFSQAKQYLDTRRARLPADHVFGNTASPPPTLPQFGVLKLGTGNSLAPILGVQRGLRPIRLLAGGADFGTRRIHLVEAERHCFTFCGLGWDAQILNDYIEIQKRIRSPVAARVFQNLLGYFAAIALKTLPEVLRRRERVRTRVWNLGERLYRVRPDGSLEKVACRAGDCFYDGLCRVAGTATTPYYGFHLKAFPHAFRVPGLMNVRILRAGVGELLGHAGSVWKGAYSSPNVFDYLAEEVVFSFSKEMPFQIGGDAAGFRKEVRLRVSDLTVDLLDFGRPQ